eukprot:327160_1
MCKVVKQADAVIDTLLTVVALATVPVGGPVICMGIKIGYVGVKIIGKSLFWMYANWERWEEWPDIWKDAAKQKLKNCIKVFGNIKNQIMRK